MKLHSFLSSIHEPQDLKDLDFGGLNRLASEIREEIIRTVSSNGGHLSSNLGVVELTIALHRVFNSPRDRIVWDVGHQCYAHKLLTGRFDSFGSLRRMGGISGFPKRSESPHDAFNTGHASTSVSAALGLLAGERLRGGSARTIAVIGDGALTGGLAYEALSHAGHLGLPLVVILNDNKMSISPNVGGLSKYLSRLSMKQKYQLFRRTFDSLVKRIPLCGEVLFAAILRLKRAVKAVFYTDNFFVDLGFEYVGPIDGHHIRHLAEVFEDVRKLERPVVIHVLTRKGKGLGSAERDPGAYHGIAALEPEEAAGAEREGLRAAGKARGERPSFTRVFGKALLAAAASDGRVTAVTAAMEKGTGLSEFRKAFPGRFFDAGIAEEHAVTFAAGLAARGLKPVAAVYSTFMQRAVDQVIHDVCLQNLPVVFALDRCGFVGEDGETHQGLFDIALFRSVPSLTLLAPAGGAELALMLKDALEDGRGPAMIRYPKDLCPPDERAFSLPLERGRGVFVRRGEGEICIAFTGSLYPQAGDAAAALALDGIFPDLYNLRFLKPVDEDYLADIIDRHELTVFVEEGMRGGGFGEYASALALRRRCRGDTLVLAAGEKYAAQGTRRELLAAGRLDGEGIRADILRFLDEREAGREAARTISFR
ncbi:MAG: 1-deoxy-D-xylulose-5-phosphate synthase [Treponema sp.]|jgi:1-deoxy-D-xylulose-5-phosphate synthase|nr:1-deoxy-D-xylulose-5-phosphate synthase [Treponema sp.]